MFKDGSDQGISQQTIQTHRPRHFGNGFLAHRLVGCLQLVNGGFNELNQSFLDLVLVFLATSLIGSLILIALRRIDIGL